MIYYVLFENIILSKIFNAHIIYNIEKKYVYI